MYAYSKNSDLFPMLLPVDLWWLVCLSISITRSRIMKGVVHGNANSFLQDLGFWQLWLLKNQVLCSHTVSIESYWRFERTCICLEGHAVLEDPNLHLGDERADVFWWLLWIVFATLLSVVAVLSGHVFHLGLIWCWVCNKVYLTNVSSIYISSV